MPLFTNHVTLLDHFVSNGSHRSFAVCWSGDISCTLSQRQLWKVFTTSVFFLSYIVPQALLVQKDLLHLYTAKEQFSLRPLLLSRENMEPFMLCCFNENTQFSHSFLFSKININLLMQYFKFSCFFICKIMDQNQSEHFTANNLWYELASQECCI